MYQHLTNEELLKETRSRAQSIREQTLILLDLLNEIYKRRLYCELSYASLFRFIVDELKFSESQAVIYTNLVKARAIELEPVKVMIKEGNLSLFSAGCAAQIINEQKIRDEQEKLNMMRSFQHLSKIESIDRANELKQKIIEKKLLIKLTQELKHKLERIKKKFNLSHQMELSELITFMADQLLTQTQEIKENKTITAKTKTLLKIQAQYRCQFRNFSGRCSETKNLEVDHIVPKSLGGSNHPNNLRIYCRAHNQKAAMNLLGAHIINKRREITAT